MRKVIIAAAIFAAVVILASFWFFSDNEEVIAEPEKLEPPQKISVYISGQVKKPAVVTLEDNGNLRLVDAVNALGGLTEFADTEAVNLAEPLNDGQHFHIPAKEIFLAEFASPSIAQNNSLVNINIADEKELQNLKGIGPALASRIVDYRNQNGPFQSPEEIKRVRGIADKKFANIKEHITVQ